MKARVIANKGFTSAEMKFENAVMFARTLEERGNTNVRVLPV